MRSFRLVYDEWLQRQPLLTKMVTSSVLFGLGDRLAQRVEKIGKTDEELEEMAKDTTVQEGHLISESAAKTVRMMVWGGMIMTPMMHTWYNLMEKVFLGTGKLVAAKKVVADMVFVAPQMPIWFYTSTGLMAGRTLRDAFDDSIDKQPMTLMANYMLWPAANSITYGVMPLQYRLLFANCVHLGWASFLSYMASHPLPTLPFLPSFKQATEDPSHTHSSKRIA
ncbi:Protein SYM1 [Phytophthora citrophthora]|uniref:Protein SYM1 n=1 Tax=Phytophthora citrophthora TaxID=4793 RepID=A0AAD9GN78_9STRA|nr:Protein SYM1 [Phytophthora citrophthora]